MTDVPDIVDVFVGTPLGTSDHALSAVFFGFSNLYRSTISEVLSFCSIVPTGTMSAVQSGALLGAPF